MRYFACCRKSGDKKQDGQPSHDYQRSDIEWKAGAMPAAIPTTRQALWKSFAGEQSGGGGTDMRRPINPHTPNKDDTDPILLLDEFTCALPDGFPDHAHRGFEAITYMFPNSPGALTHEDFLGNAGTLNPGDVQWFTAGRGIVHSEVPASEYFCRGLQLWVNLPKKDKMTQPQYRDIPHSELCKVEADGVRAVIIAGEALGASSQLQMITQIQYIHFMMEAHTKLHHPLPEGYTAIIYTLRGEATYAGLVADAHHCVMLSRGQGAQGLTVSTAGSDASFVLVAAEPIGEPVVQQGPFVMCSEAEIRQSFLDYQEQRNGFEDAHSWSSKNRHRMAA